jgi:hypothetical protein
MKMCIEDDDFDLSFGENMEDSEDSDSDSDSDDVRSDKEHGPSDNNNEEESLLLLIKEIALGRPLVKETISEASSEEEDTSEDGDTSDEEFLYDPSVDNVESNCGLPGIHPREATDINYRE